MIDPYTLVTVISGVLNATVQITHAIQKWLRRKKDQQTQYAAYKSSQPTENAARELNSLMDVQAAYWRSNPELWQALGKETAQILKSAYGKSNGYVSQIADLAASVPDRMDWNGSSSGIKSVSAQLRELFAMKLGRAIAKMAAKSVTKLFLPKETWDALANENAKLLMQAQSDIGLLAGQMAAGAAGTKKQIEWYEQQQQQQQQQQLQPQQYNYGQYYTYPQESYYNQSSPQWPNNEHQQQYDKNYPTKSGKDGDRAECIIS